MVVAAPSLQNGGSAPSPQLIRAGGGLSLSRCSACGGADDVVPIIRGRVFQAATSPYETSG